jgi:hypothetical protein
MAFVNVNKYWLGYSIPKKQFYFYYRVDGDPTVHQLYPTPEEFLGLADMFRNEGPISLNTGTQYFTTSGEDIGEGE